MSRKPADLGFDDRLEGYIVVPDRMDEVFALPPELRSAKLDEICAEAMKEAKDFASRRLSELLDLRESQGKGEPPKL